MTVTRLARICTTAVVVAMNWARSVGSRSGTCTRLPGRGFGERKSKKSRPGAL